MSLAREMPVCNIVIDLDWLCNKKYDSVLKPGTKISAAQVLMELFTLPEGYYEALWDCMVKCQKN